MGYRPGGLRGQVRALVLGLLLCVGVGEVASAQVATVDGPSSVANGATWTVRVNRPGTPPGGSWTWRATLAAVGGAKFIGAGATNGGANFEVFVSQAGMWQEFSMQATASNTSGGFGSVQGGWYNSSGVLLSNFTVNSYTVQIGSPPPTISVSVSPSSGDKPLTVTYTATVTNASSVSWSGGGTGLTQERTYTEYGTYSETATATGPGGTAQASASVTVAYEPPPPVAPPAFGALSGAATSRAAAGIGVMIAPLIKMFGVLIALFLIFRLLNRAAELFHDRFFLSREERDDKSGPDSGEKIKGPLQWQDGETRLYQHRDGSWREYMDSRSGKSDGVFGTSQRYREKSVQGTTWTDRSGGDGHDYKSYESSDGRDR